MVEKVSASRGTSRDAETAVERSASWPASSVRAASGTPENCRSRARFKQALEPSDADHVNGAQTILAPPFNFPRSSHCLPAEPPLVPDLLEFASGTRIRRHSQAR